MSTPVETFNDPVTREPVAPAGTGRRADRSDRRRRPAEKCLGVDGRQGESVFRQGAGQSRVGSLPGPRVVRTGRRSSCRESPSHPEVLDELARQFVADGLRHSQTRTPRAEHAGLPAQLGATNESNAGDVRKSVASSVAATVGRAVARRVLVATGTPHKLTRSTKEKFCPTSGSSKCPPADSAATTVTFCRRSASRSVCKAATAKRSIAPSLGQLLLLVQRRAAARQDRRSGGRVTEADRRHVGERRVIEELYLVTLSRLPTADEMQRSLKFIAASASQAEGYQDVLWSLLNQQEFVINR